MDRYSRKRWIISISSLIGLFLAIAPILDPYVLIELGSSITIKIADLFMIIFAIYSFTRSRRIHGNLFLPLLCGSILLETLLAYAGTNGIILSLSMKSIFVWLVYSLLMMYIWNIPCRESFIKATYIIGIFASTVVLLQFICGYLNIPMWDGRIPFLQLGRYDKWSGYIDYNAHAVRPCGIFQEASYVGMYLLVPYSQAIKDGKLKSAMLFAIAMFSTTSLVAILGCVIVTIYLILNKSNVDKRVVRRIIAIIVIAVFAIAYLSVTTPAVGNVVNYVSSRLFNFRADLNGPRMGSTKLRILGYLTMFPTFSTYQKIFGVGQFVTVLNTEFNYSNVFVSMILNYGLFGISVFALLLLYLWKSIKKENKVFFLITLIAFAVDYQFFSWYFFYLLSACVLKNKNNEIGGD